MQCGMLRCAQLFFTMLERSALSYLASNISTTRLVALRVLTGSWAKLELSLSALEILGLSSFELQVVHIPHGQEDIITGVGLLEPSKTGTYARYPYRELHGYSTLGVLVLYGYQA